VTVGAFVAVAAGALFVGIKATIGLRVTSEEEIAGLDVEEHGTPGYANDIGHGAVPGVGAHQLAGAPAVGG
jgi:Amt family ammonium transporter